MIHRWRNKKAHGQHQECQSGTLQAARQQRQLVELILKNAIELKTEQYLRAEKQKPIFIQRGFEFVVEFHFINWKGEDDFGSTAIMASITRFFAGAYRFDFHNLSSGPLAPNTGSLRGRLTFSIDLTLRS